MKKRILTILTAIIGAVMPIMMAAAPVYAAPNWAGGGTNADCCKVILGFKPWYCNGPNGNEVSEVVGGKCEIKSPSGDSELKAFITTIVGNVLSDLFVATAYIAIGFIIYSGFMYITSDGNPSKAAKAQKGLAGSIVGLVISVAAAAIVRFVMEVLLSGAIGTSPIGTGTPEVDVAALVNSGLNTAYGIAAVVAVGYIIYGGITFATSNGDASKVGRARKMLLYSIIGLVVVILAYAITTFVINNL